MKKVSISVTDLALPAPRKGSIDVYSGFGRGQQLGIEIHQKIQSVRIKERSNYQAEVLTSHSFEAGGYRFEVSGRMDGFIPGEDPFIEEIKSSFRAYPKTPAALNAMTADTRWRQAS